MPSTKSSESLLRRLESARKSKNLSQKDFAALLGMDQTNYSKLKNGDLTLDPLLSTVERFAARLKMSVCELVGEGPQTIDEKIDALPDSELHALLRKVADRLQKGR